jgi:hypothetical protein
MQPENEHNYECEKNLRVIESKGYLFDSKRIPILCLPVDAIR